jgi:hypothetical protein
VEDPPQHCCGEAYALYPLRVYYAARQSILILVAIAASAQTSDTPFTIQVHRSDKVVNAKSAHGLDITLKNTGSKPASAYVLRTEFRDRTTDKLVAATVVRAIKLQNAAIGGVGQQWANHKPIFIAMGPDGAELKYNVTLDYVVFDDGSSWGPDISKLGNTMLPYIQQPH